MKNQHERYQFHMHYHLNLRPRPAAHVPATSLLRLEASAASSYEIFIIFSFSWIVTSSSFSSSGLRARLGSTFCMLGAQTRQAKQETKCLIISRDPFYLGSWTSELREAKSTRLSLSLALFACDCTKTTDRQIVFAYTTLLSDFLVTQITKNAIMQFFFTQ